MAEVVEREGYKVRLRVSLSSEEVETAFQEEGSTQLDSNAFRAAFASLAGQPIRLHFIMKDADLYSMQFQPI